MRSPSANGKGPALGGASQPESSGLGVPARGFVVMDLGEVSSRYDSSMAYQPVAVQGERDDIAYRFF